MEKLIEISTSRLVRVFGVIVLLLFCVGDRSHTFAQEIGTKKDMKLAEKAAEEFFKSYLENQRSKDVFECLVSKMTIGGLRNSGFFEEFGFDTKLIRQLDDQKLLDVYRTIMNSYFVGTLYNEIVFKDSKNVNDPIPNEVLAVYTKSELGQRYLERTSDENESDSPFVSTEKDQIEYIELVEQSTYLLERYLPNKLFDRPEFKKRYQNYCLEDRCKAFIDNSGDDDFDIAKGIPIYIVNKYPFTIHFIKEGDKMKILRFGIGN